MSINLPIYEEDTCILYALGRNAMYAACQGLGLKPGDEIVTPAFDSDSAIQPFTVLGLKPRFYRSKPNDFSVDLEDLKRLISDRTKMIHVINHFGFSQDWDALLKLRSEAGVPIMEDNAYSLFSSYKGRSCGTFGDVSIFSLRKNLPLVNGGMLRINNMSCRPPAMNERAGFVSLTELDNYARITKNRLGINKLPIWLRNLARKVKAEIDPPPPLYDDKARPYPSWPYRDVIGKEFSRNYTRPISGIARRQLEKYSALDFEAIVHQKREYYAYSIAKISGMKGITVMWPQLPEGATPFSVSVLVDRGRDRLLATLRLKYDVMAWPTLSGFVLNELDQYPDVALLGRRLFQINLPSERVRKPTFMRYLDNLIYDMGRILNES